MGMLVELGSAFGVLARVVVSASSALFLAYLVYIAGLLSTASVARGIRRLRRRAVPAPSEVKE